MIPKHSLTTSLLALILCLATAGSAAAAGMPSIDSSLATWDAVPGHKLTLTVSGGGQDYRFELGAGEPASFSIFDAAGQLLPDGGYTWQLTAAPVLSKEEMRVLAEARDSGVTLGAKAAGGFTESGYLTIDGGAFATPSAVEGSANKDQVILDDLIVDGSACIGIDCVNGESFGFDTLRLKENNLRIKFDDTSSSGSFPFTDWQLTANDSDNGGANKFSIDDITNGKTPFTVEANAPTHSLFVDDGGRVGMGTNTPVVQLHVKDGNTPTLRLEQDGSSGFTAQTWDVAGNEANFFVRDATNGSTLPFRIQPGAPTNSISVRSNGGIGMGIQVPGTMDDGNQATVHVRRNDGTAGVLIEEASGTTNDSRFLLEMRNNGFANFTMTDTSSNDSWDFSAAGAFRISKQQSGAAEFALLAGGDLEIAGELTTSGSCSMGCDRVFSDEYEVESIEEHAEHMWQNSYLEGVGPTPEGKPFNISQKTQGMLNELEKAHIYIEQLNDGLKDKNQRIDQLEADVAELKALLALLTAR